MKYLIIGLVILSGCATVSEYNQGCRDGLNGLPVKPELAEVYDKAVIGYCNQLDSNRLGQADSELPKNPNVKR
jgi:hypothetical protein